jgi:2-polyprenyl-3-methyl-5-hydroxy-6-metoxy-1,4-benzoquinol methylase
MGAYLFAAEMEFVERSLAEEGPGCPSVLLDVGGGSGRLAVPLASRGYRAVVLEADALPLQWLRRQRPDHPAVLTDPHAESWPILTESVDCVLAMEVPMVACAWFWAECRRVLREGGILVVCTTNRHSYKGMVYRLRPLLRSLLRKRWKDGRDAPDFYPFSAADALALMRAHGLACEHIRGLNWLPARRSSDSVVVPLWAALERVLGLRRLGHHSPWVLLKARATGCRPGSLRLGSPAVDLP